MSRSEAIDKAFKEADNLVKTGNDPNIQLSNSDKLTMYGLYKQITVGECKGNQLKHH
jgi:hypothetical protein